MSKAIIDYTDAELDAAIRAAEHITLYVADFLAERDRRRAEAEARASDVRAARLERATWLAVAAPTKY